MESGRHVADTPRTAPKRKMKPLWLVIVIDILLSGVILCTFSLFHHVIPSMNAKRAASVKPSAPTPTVAVTPAAEATPAASEAPAVSEAPVDNRTEWQKKFAEHFTDEIIVTENSYSSPNISVELQTHSVDIDGRTSVYHVADIYVASLDNLRTYTAHGGNAYMDAQNIMDMDADVNPILAISGDYVTLQYGGFLMRNGELLNSEYTYCDICVLYPDGRMVTYPQDGYNIDEILANDPLQIWNFGPALLDADGHVKDSYNVSMTVSYPNPRSAIGYYEPGHYCFVVVDGRQDGYSYGLRIPELAAIFEELGCTEAYNLDGGGSAVMVFNHEKYSRQSNGGRDLGDIIYVAETEG